MNTSDFLAHVLGDDGHYCVFGAKAATKQRVQKFYSSIDRLVHAAIDLDGNGFDAYFALATFETDESRTKDNAKQLRALFLDLDCGEDKDFPDQSAALAALRDFCKAVGMPRPYIVSSGRGIHVYWPLAAPVSVEQWLPVASKLKRTCAAADFGADPAVTSDAARVLRVPLTHNHKSDPPAEVYVLNTVGVTPSALHALEALLDKYMGDATPAGGLFVPSPARLPTGGNALMDRLRGNKEASFRAIMLRAQKGDGCGQLVHALTNQAEIDEPLWRAALSVAKFCSDGVKAAHKLSDQHPEYSYDETEYKLRTIKGPYTCAKFNEYNPGLCASCPHFNKIKSPIVLGQQVLEATPEDNVVEVPATEEGAAPVTVTIPEYPKPYFRGKYGGIYLREAMEDPDELPREVCIYPNDFYFERRVFDHSLGEMMLAKLHLPKDGVRAFTVSLRDLTSRDKLRESLSYYGVVASNTKQWESIMSYTTTWAAHLQATTVADEARRQFGWTSDDMTSFVIGDREIFADRVDFNPPSSVTVPFMAMFEKSGSVEGWKQQGEFFNRAGMEPWQFKIGHTIGSPLMRFFPAHAAIFAIYSDGSGHGKTTTQAFGLTAYGDPRMMMFSKKDTINSKELRMEIYKDLPVEFDEVTNMASDVLSDLVYGAYEGRQKNRMAGGNNVERFRGEPWKLCMGMSSNVSPMSRIMETKASPKGELQRVLEHHIHAYQFSSKAETDAFASDLGRHTGHVAEPFVQYIMQNKDKVRALLTAVQTDIDKRADLTMENRYWSVTAAVSIVSLIICRELDLLRYDIKAVTDWAVKMIEENKRRDVEATFNVENVVNEYVSENYSNILWIKSTDDRRGSAEPVAGIDSLVVPDHEPRGRLVGRYETDLKMLYLLPKPLRAWCAKQQLNYESVLAAMVTKMHGQRRKVRISKGTKLNLPPTDAIIVDCSALEIEVEGADGGSKA
jgi:hypothetical protein